MTTDTQLVLITSAPHSRAAQSAIDYVAQRLLQQLPTSVFFYADGAYTANRLIWQTADIPNLVHQWADLAKQHQLPLPVCVSTALARGITDAENAKRHQLDAHNLHPAFNLVGLSELALLIDSANSIKQF